MIQEVATKHYEEGMGMKIHRGSKQTKVEKNEQTGKLTIYYEDKNGPAVLEDVDTLIWAIGRAPETEGLQLQKLGIKTNSKGHVMADDFQNTNVESIFSLGDVSGKVELTPGTLMTIVSFFLSSLETLLMRSISCHRCRPPACRPSLRWP